MGLAITITVDVLIRARTVFLRDARALPIGERELKLLIARDLRHLIQTGSSTQHTTLH